MLIYALKVAQKVILQVDKAVIAILSEYLEYADVFLANLAIELLEYNDINDYAIELVKGKWPLYRPIYSLGLVELVTIKIYI